MDDIRRQRHQGDRQASIAFARGDIEAVLANYQSQEAIHVIGRDDFVGEVVLSKIFWEDAGSLILDVVRPLAHKTASKLVCLLHFSSALF